MPYLGTDRPGRNADTAIGSKELSITIGLLTVCGKSYGACLRRSSLRTVVRYLPLLRDFFGQYKTFPASTLMLGALLFTIQLYADFSGYSDMAILSSPVCWGLEITRKFQLSFFSAEYHGFLAQMAYFVNKLVNRITHTRPFGVPVSGDHVKWGPGPSAIVYYFYRHWHLAWSQTGHMWCLDF